VDDFWNSTEATLCPYCDQPVTVIIFLITCVPCGRSWMPGEHHQNWLDRTEGVLEPLAVEAQS
jgi:uncharacterized protein with PIN domain